MSHFRYKHTVSLTFFRDKISGPFNPSSEPAPRIFDPAEIVDGFETCDDDFLPDIEESTRYKCWLKRDITFLISSIHMYNACREDLFILRLGGETNDRPHDVMLKMAPGIQGVHLIDPLPLPARMGLYMVIPDGACITIVGRAASDVLPPAEKKPVHFDSLK